MCVLRLAGQVTQEADVLGELFKGRNPVERQKVIAIAGFDPTTLRFARSLELLCDEYARREIALTGARLTAVCKQPDGLESARRILEEAQGFAAGRVRKSRSNAEIAAEIVTGIGAPPSAVQITTGLPSFDRYGTPIEPHEYVVVGARTSHGKSSFLTQLAGRSLQRGLRVAYYSLETSDTAVMRQIAGQWAKVNVKRIDDEPADRLASYRAALTNLGQSKNLAIFDQAFDLHELQAHARLIAASFKPHVVFLDYLGQLKTPGDNLYQKTTLASKAMLPLKKQLGCALIVACQIGRGVEKEDRRPERTDFKDSGSIEDDASRIIALWRKPKQALDAGRVEYEILQLKMRDGPTMGAAIVFQSTRTTFEEEAKL